MTRSVFVYKVDRHKGWITIVDTGTTEMTVTNDIENVIAFIKDRERIEDLSKWKIIYKDSNGIWDAIIVTPKGGIVFHCLNSKTPQYAMWKYEKEVKNV